jgi:transcriptional regulator
VTLYVPSHFRIEDPKVLDAFIAANAFGTLVSSGPGGLHASHLPFVPEREAGGTLRLRFHLARANPQAAALAEASHVLAIFQGPHGYVSPTWYENHPAVPTWNYAVAHAQGRIEGMDEAGLRALLEKLSSHYEAGTPEPWTLGGTPPGFIEKLLPVIVGYTLVVDRLDGKFKLSQNRPGDDARRVAERLEAGRDPALASLMREHPPRR